MCMQRTGRPPIKSKLVDVDRDRYGHMLAWSRLVAEHFKVKGATAASTCSRQRRRSS
jgi:hypothetical protein